MSNNINQLQRKIMRRVYYSFFLSIIASRAFVSGVLLAVGLYGVKVMVHVASFVENLQSIEFQNVGTFMFNAVTHTDVYTLLFVGLVIFSLLSFNFSILKGARVHERMQTV